MNENDAGSGVSTRAGLVALCDVRLLNVRNEHSFSQETMAHALGISKKTLVDIEKGRRSLGWSGALALVALFPESRGLARALPGVEPLEFARALMHDGREGTGRVTRGGGWWTRIESNEWCSAERNVVSRHYRLVEPAAAASSLSYEEIHDAFLEHAARHATANTTAKEQ